MPRLRRSHIFAKEENSHYVEPSWVAERLFDHERFPKPIWDPSCGWGRIPEAAIASARYRKSDVVATDLMDRGYGTSGVDFIKTTKLRDGARSIICNPPFDLFEEFTMHALELGAEKVAMIALVRRLPAARWLRRTPLSCVWLLTPRPSMPSGDHITNGGKVGGGTQDFAWLVFTKGHEGPPEMRWLERDGNLLAGGRNAEDEKG